MRHKLTWVVAVAAAVLGLGLLTWFRPYGLLGHYGGMMRGYGKMMGGYGYGMMNGGYWMMGIGTLFNFLIPVLVIGLIVYFLARKRDHFLPRVHTLKNGDEPVTVLKTRYSKGEISQEEYRRIREELER